MHRAIGPGRARCLLGVVLCMAPGAYAQEAEYDNYQSEYFKRLKSYETIQPYGETPFGESIDLATGQVTFSQADVVLEGTGPTIRISRSRPANIENPAGREPVQLLGDWTLDIPRISTLVPAIAWDGKAHSP